MKDYTGKTVWIIGASTGIGHALSMELSKRGAQLILSARDADALNVLNILLGNHHQCLPLDVSDATKFADIFAGLKDKDINSVVYLAATYTPGSVADISAEDMRQAIATNLEGAFTLLRHIVPCFTQRGKGQIALCGSVAGYRGLPDGQPYSATKAALINLAESLHVELSDKNIDVKLISPGFVKTRLTDKNNFPMPMIIEPDEAARAIADGLLGRKFEVRFPAVFTTIMKMIQMMPYAIYFALIRRLNRKA